jgi:hypothetical protein
MTQTATKQRSNSTLDTTSWQKWTTSTASGSSNKRQSRTANAEEDEEIHVVTQYTEQEHGDDDEDAFREEYSNNNDENPNDDEGNKEEENSDDDEDNEDDNDDDDDYGHEKTPQKKPRGVTNKKYARQPLQRLNERDCTEAPRAVPGTLMYLSEQAKGDDSVNGMAAATHINKWTTILGQDGAAFERAMHKESRRLTRHPIAFAFLEPASNKVQLMHGIKEISMDNEEHEAEGRVGFFVATTSWSQLMTLCTSRTHSSVR